MSRNFSLFDLQVNGFAGVDFQRANLTDNFENETARVFVTASAEALKK